MGCCGVTYWVEGCGSEVRCGLRWVWSEGTGWRACCVVWCGTGLVGESVECVMERVEWGCRGVGLRSVV